MILANPSLHEQNRDEVAIGGFGNLIALPLQGERVKKGYRRFIDRHFKLIEDIWGILEQTPKISYTTVDNIINKIGQKLPVQYFKPQANKQNEILLLDDSEVTSQSFDNSIEVISKNELVIKRSEISKKALIQLKFLATFHNQNFYIAQRKRLSTYGIPRLISLAEINDHEICLPRGLKNKVTELFPNAYFSDKLSQGTTLKADFNGRLSGEQNLALEALAAQDMGILSAGTGFGKTVIAAKLIADKKVNALVLVNNKNLALQWKAQLEKFLTIEGEPIEERTKTGRKKKKAQIGKIYGGKMDRSGLVDIALFQSLTKLDNLKDIINQYGMIIVDEAHHVAAKTFEDVIKTANCRYLYGLTATPKREDHLENILYMRLGNIAYTATKEIPIYIDQKLFMRFTSLGEHEINNTLLTIHENYELMLESDERNSQIVFDICENLKEKRHVIVLSRYVKHLDILNQLLEEKDLDAPIYILNSKLKNKVLRKELMNLKQEGRSFVLLTTGSYAGEGFDLPALDTLLLTMPISGKSNLQQYLGRLLRNLDEKSELRVYDYVDYAIPMIYRMYQKRLRTYKQLGYHLYEDEHTESSKSSIMLEHYHKILDKDLLLAQKGLLVLPYLNKKNISTVTLNKSISKFHYTATAYFFKFRKK
ncbi:hypothetical protein IGI37_000146 [Enterococcus sp. AZ194]|uniref:DEAD/DEAH box helicase family protein n=1 Tax=Enterococcus sp. AZ194 TaxID=2774629 RepID=UPI003F1EB8F5